MYVTRRRVHYPNDGKYVLWAEKVVPAIQDSGLRNEEEIDAHDLLGAESSPG